jgi:hypothetical protein
MYLKWTEIFSAMLFPWGGFFLMFQHGKVTRRREEERREERGERREERRERREERGERGEGRGERRGGKEGVVEEDTKSATY